MRHLHTFVVTIYYDSETPDVLRGRVRYLNGEQESPFASQDELVSILGQALQTARELRSVSALEKEVGAQLNCAPTWED